VVDLVLAGIVQSLDYFELFLRTIPMQNHFYDLPLQHQHDFKVA
jgi:hypothetical protein